MRREFKICGQIGELGQRDNLSYLSLVLQIEMGTEKGHSETGIVEETKSESTNTQQIIEELRQEMKQMFMTVMETSYRPSGPKPREKGCKKVREEENGENCAHCGREGHFSCGCRAQRQSGNGEGLLRCDQQ